MSCPLRRFDDVKLQTPSRPTNTAAVKELSDKLVRMKQEREKQDTIWTTNSQETTSSFYQSKNRERTNVGPVVSHESR